MGCAYDWTGQGRLPALAAVFAVLLGASAPAQDKVGAPAAPDRLETLELVWTTLIAVDQANRTGNYSVLRDLGAQGFREVNDQARLAAIFAGIREQDIGLNHVVVLTPVFTEPPRVMENGYFRVAGHFPTRPESIRFEMLFQHDRGTWRLFGIGIAPVEPPELRSNETPVPAPSPTGQ